MKHLLALAAVLLIAGCSSAPVPDAGNCSVCGKPNADGPEVRLVREGESGPGKQYRCFMCPIMEGLPEGGWTMRAVSGVDGTWVTFRSKDGRVESDPATAVLLAMDVSPGAECLNVHRVFADEDEFRRYLAAHPDLKSSNPKPQKFQDVLGGKSK
ncbi:MAG: hypothetical protein AAB074_18760 [Planctomycetota bacterium]